MKFYNKDIKVFKIKTHSPEWYKFRAIGTDNFIGGTGGSEISHILGLSDYTPSVVKLFHQKVGTMPLSDIDNEPMFHGRLQEDTVAKLWQFYDGTENGYMERYKNYLLTKDKNNIIRKNKHVGGYITNKKYPYIFISLDYISENSFPIIDSQYGLFSSGEIIKYFPVECKTLSEYVYKDWEASIPDSYIIQVNMQMMVLDVQYAEVAAIIGGNKFRVFPIERNDNICNSVFNTNKKFWENHVLPARKVFEEYKKAKQSNSSSARSLYAEIQKYEPIIDSSKAYSEEATEMHEADFDVVLADDETFEYALHCGLYSDIISELKKIKEGYDNKLKQKFVQEHCETISFDEDGSIRYFLAKGKNNKQLDFKRFKVKPEEDEIKKWIKGIKAKSFYKEGTV